MMEDRLKAIGQITLEFARLEWLLDNLYAGLNCDFQKRDNPPTEFDSLSKRLTLIGYRIEKKYASRLREWQELEWEIRKLARERNRLLDSAAVGDTESEVFITRETPGEFSAEEGSKLSEKIVEAHKKVSVFQTSIRLA
jgi:hypothetical protein